jgi:hypothetical protein
MQLGEHVLFMSFYLESCIWPVAISRCLRQRNGIKFCADPGKCVKGEPGHDHRSVWGREHEPHAGVSTACSPQSRSNKASQLKNKVKSMLIISFHIKEIAHNEFVLARQPNSAYYCDVLRRLRENSLSGFINGGLSSRTQLHGVSYL